MKIAQNKLREIVLQFLYSWEIKAFDDAELVPLIMEMVQVSKTNATIALEKGKTVLERTLEIDQLIKDASTDYDLERISLVDHTILRLMLYEMLYTALPVEVTVHEGVRLSNKFSSPGASGFVHAIIDAVNRNKKSCDKALI